MHAARFGWPTAFAILRREAPVMPREDRAIVFDLDDTLYPLRSFVLSGFAAVARDIERRFTIPARRTLGVLSGAARGSNRGCELQLCIERFGLAQDELGYLIDVIRLHTPAIRLPRDTQRVLRVLRGGWKLGVLTNGSPDIQSRKAIALGLDTLVDAIVFAHEVGDRTGKPAPEPFLEIARQLDVEPGRIVFVGDDPHCDVFGAARAGMHTIQITPGESLKQVPQVAARMVGERWTSYVA